ncbi:MAG: DUF3995 domain-containing protein [Thermoleophilaceae bacterium]|jgi:hypothetical protein|nr:DUF3995 domain-containing protein [Thermoleophilaceae bacterium]
MATSQIATTPGDASAPTPSMLRSATRARAVGHVAVAILAAAFAFHLYWTLGGEWGAVTAYGSTDLPPRGVVAVVTLLIAAAALLVACRISALAARLPAGLLRWGPWLLVGAFALVGLGNLTAPADSYARDWHIFFFGPLLLILAALCAVVARSPVPGSRSRRL